jgi:hypothetical protein
MTHDPSDRLAEQIFGERLHALARGVNAPIVPPDDDVRRGRRRLFRMRVSMAGATTATLAVVLGITSLTAGDPKANELPEITHPPTVLPASPDSSPSADKDDGSGDQGRGRGNTARVGGGSSGGPSSQGTDAADPDAPPDGIPVKNAPTGDASTGAADPGHHQASDDPTSDDTESPTSTPSGTPTQTPSGTATSQPTDTPTTTPTATPTIPPTQATKVRVHRVLAYYNDVLAEHLDPDRAHLEPYDRTVDPKESRTGDGHLYALGSTYRWAGGASPSGLGITVASGWDQVDWDCGASYADWACHDGTTADTEVARHDGVLQVAVEHASGQVVVLTSGPPATVRLSDRTVGNGEADLAAAAADERLILPGVAPVAPPTIGLDAFAGGLAALVTPREAFEQNGSDRTPWVRGAWTGTGGQQGSLAWSAAPIYSGGGFTCLETYRSCSEVSVDANGTTVHLALLKPKAGGGWLVQYDGPSYGVRVYSSNPTFPKKRAYAFVTQPVWQPRDILE